LKVGKEAFTDCTIATRGSATPPASAVTADAREGALPSAQPRKFGLQTFRKYMKAPFLAPRYRKGAFMYLGERV
ncbi:hypothetical protein AB0E55_39305, partial [Amycolatopsis keratiniphila]|uniref:hypothetical protein n=1 Tax=Amycolatopsis keratiniphila TaxID=129921 RepID=UPI0033FD32EE